MEYKSKFRNYLQEFVSIKRAAGLKYETQERILLRFDSFLCNKYPESTAIGPDIIMDWCAKKPHEHVKTLEGRVVPVRSFCRYLQMLGEDAYVMPEGMLPKSSRYQPYIYSDDEIRRINQSADMLESVRGSKYIHLVMPALLRVLQGCGTRIGETCSLETRDVALDDGLITIKSGKMDKSRVVPMSGSLREYLVAYRSKLAGTDDGKWFFPSKHGNHVCSSSVNKHFHSILNMAEISSCGRNRLQHGANSPRIHDFRHTFAVNCLKAWVKEGMDIYSYLPVLQVYMGHSSIDATAYYLHLTADLFPDITQKLEAAFGNVIPKGGGTDENY